MTKDEMINKIDEVIANKTLSFWCRVWYNIVQSYIVSSTDTRHIWKYRMVDFSVWSFEKCHKQWIIWHPVMIGDVYQWLFDNKMESNVVYVKNPIRWWKVEPYSSNKEFIFWRRENRREPIENQSDYCITFIYNLIASHVPKKENSN